MGDSTFLAEKNGIEQNIIRVILARLETTLGPALAHELARKAHEARSAAGPAEPGRLASASIGAAASGEPMTILTRRRLEAEVIKWFFRAIAEEAGQAQAEAIIGEAVADDAREAGRSQAALLQGRTDLATFAEILPKWSEGGATVLTVLESSAQKLRYQVTRCLYAEMYQELNMRELGFHLSCRRDAAFMEGYAPGVELTRTMTIMTGGKICDFSYEKVR
ncbi:MAG: L-2-amino-thiazoline-4-carboxylic acid hydrolase [Deltaproteobacteria bacterium]|jgi:hypothetical protein|nr:L-2-amino-thiazoline-4-carboxylic acid hydrolase [Deltaproteobacteria bacterium]